MSDPRPGDPSPPGTTQQGLPDQNGSSSRSNGAAPEAYGPTEMVHAATVESNCEATRLMTLARSGDVQAFEELFHTLRGRTFQVARSIVGSREDALDLTQEAFTKLYTCRESYDPSQPFLPWFHRILRNACFSFLRRRGRGRSRSLQGLAEDGEDVTLDLVDEGPAPSAALEAADERQLFQEAIARLAPRDREILALRHYEELSYKEIASALEIPEGTVMSRLFHARRRLRELLGPALGLEAEEART